jgi:hypothetical protein
LAFLGLLVADYQALRGDFELENTAVSTEWLCTEIRCWQCLGALLGTDSIAQKELRFRAHMSITLTYWFLWSQFAKEADR